MLPAEPRQLLGLPRLGKVPGGIVGMHQHNRLGARRNGTAKSLGIDLPSLVVHQRNRFDAHIVKHGQKVEQGIARLGNQNLRARIAQQPEKEAVSLAGAGGQHNLFRLHSRAQRSIVRGHRISRCQAASWLRIVIERPRIGQRGQQAGVIGQPAAGRVAGGQVGHRQPRLHPQPMSARQLAFLRVPACSL